MSDNNTQSNGPSMPSAQSVDLAGLVGLVPQSIVSRTLVKRAGGTVTLFGFAEGQGLSEHTAPFDALVVVLEGRAELTIGGSAVAAAQGQAVLMPANVPHALRAVEPFKMLLVMIREPSAAAPNASQS